MRVIEGVLKVLNRVERLEGMYGVFGVNGFGAFLTNYFPKKILFLVDEDREKWNLKFLDKAILSPNEAKKPILLAFRNAVATKEIYKKLRLKYPNVEFINLFKECAQWNV